MACKEKTGTEFFEEYACIVSTKPKNNMISSFISTDLYLYDIFKT